MKKQANFTELQLISYTYKQMLKGQTSAAAWWDFIATKKTADVKRITSRIQAANVRLYNYTQSFKYKTKIRKYCNLWLYSDVIPFEVVRVQNSRRVWVREMDTVQTVTPKSFIQGGFTAYCADNGAQRYEYISNTERPVICLRLGKNGWSGGAYKMADKPVKFYDYNF